MSIATLGRSSTGRTITVLTWVFDANHVEEATDKRTMWQSQKFTSVEEMVNPFLT
jgi:hypothetical protein